MPCFTRDLKDILQTDYAGAGKFIAENFYIPVLKKSKYYDRISGYFSLDSLVITATGIAGLINNGGTMRLILGAHDFGGEVVEAYKMSREKGQELISTIGNQIAKNLDSVENLLYTKRLEALAWMLAEKKLEIHIAIPKRQFIGSGRGIFHEKSLIFSDEDNCKITAVGSTNESRAAWEVNGENVTIFPSWNPGVEQYIKRHTEHFELLWTDQDKDYYTFTLPEAVAKKISERFYRPQKPEYDPYEDPEVLRSEEKVNKLVPVARLVLEIGNIRGLAHLGLGPVSLYPHQAYVVEQVLKRFPYRVLLADEVGLGKTLEAGAIVKRLLDMKRVSRVCILTPKNVSKQWLDEMWNRFGLNFSLLASNPKRFISGDGQEHLVLNENPFDKPGFDHVIASWHYARGTKLRGQEILDAQKFFDLIIIDEAHAARKNRSDDPPVATKLKQLADELSATSPHIILMSATPLQMNELEALDILEILGLGGKWIHEFNFSRYYNIIKKQISDVTLDDWLFGLDLASDISQRYISDEDLKNVVEEIFGKNILTNKLRSLLKSSLIQESDIHDMVKTEPEKIKKLLIALNPMNWFMIRNTRERLTKLSPLYYKFPERIIQEEDVYLDDRHEKIIESLNDYLNNDYGKYEKLVSPQNKGIIGFVRSIYHQRFVSSFTAAYMTISNRYDFLNAVLQGDEEAMRNHAERLLRDVESDEDEEDIIETIKLLVQQHRNIVLEELRSLEKLKTILLPYSPSQMSDDEPKLKKVYEIVRKQISTGNKVLVFSKYTDTVDAIRKYLQKHGFPMSNLGIYTGDGGQLFDSKIQQFKKCGKEDVTKALNDDLIDILVCSDAAGEGLNLQSASVLINVDMPWNPAKVEQRIGRIDRLGQKAKQVIVYNIWYPDSIEAKMYKMLFERKEIYNLVVGPAQEIVSIALRHALDTSGRGLALENIIREVKNEIENMQQLVVQRGGILEGMSWKGNKEDDEKAIHLTSEFLKMACDSLGLKYSINDKKFFVELGEKYKDLERWNGSSLEIGNPKVLTPSHPIISVLAQEILYSNPLEEKSDTSIYTVKDHNNLADLIVMGKEITAPETMNGSKSLNILEKLLEEAKN